MKYIFIVNPMSGQGQGNSLFVNKIETICREIGTWEDTEIYITKSVGDGESYTTAKVVELFGEEVRFYACGGDGTNNEVINGIMAAFKQFPNNDERKEKISIGCIPIGTGNDTIRNFSEAGDFSKIQNQIFGISRKVDLINYSGKINGVDQSKYCVNMFNIGFDCNVVELAGRLKKKPLIAGSAAYLMAVFGMFVVKKGISLKLMEKEKILVDGEVLLCSIANGSYCGGGIYSSPQASMNDGVFDLNIVKDVSRKTFLNLFPKYKKGTHLESKGVEEIMTIKKCTELTLEPKGPNFFLCVDGEINLAEKVKFKIVPEAINFIVPIRDMER